MGNDRLRVPAGQRSRAMASLGLAFGGSEEGTGEICSGQAEDRSTSSTLQLSSRSVNGFTSR
jgi:hypothetical protein